MVVWILRIDLFDIIVVLKLLGFNIWFFLLFDLEVVVFECLFELVGKFFVNGLYVEGDVLFCDVLLNLLGCRCLLLKFLGFGMILIVLVDWLEM